MSIQILPRWRAPALATLLAVSAWAAALPAPALAADATGTDSQRAEHARLAEMQKKLDHSLHMIDALAARVRELEAKAPAGAAASVAAPAAAAASAPTAPTAPAASTGPAAEAQPDPRLAAVEQKVEQIEATNAMRHGDDTGLPLHGFLDVGAGTHNPWFPQWKGGYVDNLDFYLTPKLGEHTRALVELNNEVGSSNAVDVDLERAQIGYQFSDAALVWLGRFHTPYGYLNTAVHHGAWINDELRRPSFLDFEDHGGILPAHTVGIWLTGAEHVASGRLQYDAYAGNSQLIEQGTLDMRSAGNSDGKLMFGGRLGYNFSGTLDGLLVGVHAFSASRVADDLPIPHATRVTAYGAFLSYDSDQWEANSEVYFFDDQDLTNGTGTHRSDAEFVQLGYRFQWGIPYVRLERTDLDQTDEYFQQQLTGNSYERGALGLRYDLDSKAALKFEIATTRMTDRTRQHFGEELLQYAVRF